MTNLAKKLEALMAFDDNQAFDKLDEFIGGGEVISGDAVDLAEWQHARDLEVLRKMAAVIEKCDETIDLLGNHHRTCECYCMDARGLALEARAEIVRLVSDE